MSKANASDTMTQSITPRQAHEMLMQSIDTLRQKMATTDDVALTVEIGSLLWDLINAADKALKEVKIVCRQEAWKALQGQVGTHTLEGTDLGEATVNIPKAQWKLKKGKDVDGLKTAMGSNFSLFFEEVVTHKPRSEWDKLVSSPGVDPLHKQLLMDSVNREEPTPRVSFRRNKLPKGES